jgi:hypothetical protein
MKRNRQARSRAFWHFQFRNFHFPGLVVLAIFGGASSARAQSDEYRFTVSPYNNISGNLTGVSQFGYGFNPDLHYQRFIMQWPGVDYKVNDWLQLWGGLYTTYLNNESAPDTLQLRPFIGPKLFLPNPWKWDIYNYTRFEYLDTLNLQSGGWSNKERLRSRFGIQFPLVSLDRAWQPKTWYGLADVEPSFYFNDERIDALNVRLGGGYIVNDRIRVEFIYTAQFGRPNGGSLQFAENGFRINLRIGLNRGILNRVLNQSPADDETSAK